MTEFNAEEIISFISNAKKTTPLKIYVNTALERGEFPESFHVFGGDGSYIIFADHADWAPFEEMNRDRLDDVVIEQDRRNSAVPLLDATNVNARIEPGAYIREHAVIGDHAVIMMGAVINIGAVVGEGTMVDMNAVLGGRAATGRNVHVGAGAVLAGVIEPASATPVTVGDNVLIGANAVLLEGVQVGDGAVIAAGSIVTDDVPAGAVVAGVPARIIKQAADVQAGKVGIVDALRKLND
ncbi:2,3,4,5-tetrahydropyridine-2,6-dicarboxylate N-acetyltransferase [Bhargavaea cecembensis]|uniref:2,3,4,5-tetrahydropyridine-2,6-dicarboxylate N-acetyltransferase n=1 Tax=Bhargavaea cecembensis TaxID=394098 RepID=UPI000590DA7D|nr:2,3,4,5-tetrahydropyridine-2,6-dicarboxylate N-acetyltransferase [Bhargavaea cecembensis]